MKVLHLATHLNIGGITTYISKMAPALKKIGVETLALSSGGACSDDFHQKSVKTFELPIKTKSELNPKIYFALPALKKIIVDNKIDLLHAHTRITQVMAAILSRKVGIPVVTTCHGYYKNRLGRRIFPAWGDYTVAISDGVAEHLRKDFKLPDEKIIIVNNGVDLEEIDRAYSSHDPQKAKQSYGFQTSDPVIGLVARIVADKGHEYLLRAVPVIQKKFPDIRVLIVGEGRHRKYLENLTWDLKIQDAVVFTGNLRDVSKPLAAMDIFTLPATWREGFGLSIVEAMACRKPVIVSNIWALNSLIENRVTGILIPPKQSAPLAEAVQFLLSNPGVGVQMADRARKMTEDHFTVPRMAAEMKTVYERALEFRAQFRPCP